MKLANDPSDRDAMFEREARASHRDLVARVAREDAGALRQLYGEFSNLVYSVARRILADQEDVRETVQDTFIKVWRQASTYRAERGEVIAWIIFITRNTAIDRARKGARRRLVHEAFEREPHDAVHRPENVTDERERLHEPLSQLSPAQRQALELTFISGCSQSEIATAMQTPISNVKNHVRRGLLKLRQTVTRYE